MQITDTIADMLTRIRNANSAKHDTVDIPASNMKKAIAQILVDEGYVKSFQVIEDGKQGVIRVTLKYQGANKSQVLMGLRRVSKPGLRIYSSSEDMPKAWHSFGKGGRKSMSRIGRKPIAVPAGVDVSIADGVVTVKGAKGTLTQKVHPNMTVTVENGEVLVTRPNDEKENRALHGLTRSLIANMVTGVTQGFSKKLEVNGVGYRVQKQGKDLVMNLGYSHQVCRRAYPPQGRQGRR